ncbi:MAG TPA: PDZ domain-containing protein, partial [Arenimonas sp.]|nr:PDZ domain-containing protein [Arenimonas sp.]
FFRPALILFAASLALVAPLHVVGAAAAATASAPAPSTIAAARDKVLPVVVSIMTVREDFKQGEPVLTVSSGSGTVVTPEGHVATNAHVTQQGKSFRVVFADGRELPARLVGTDTLSDLAVLQVQPPKPETFAYARFADEPDLSPGDTVLAMGAPWGLSNSMSAGVVNNPRRLLVSLFDDEADYEDRLGADEPTGRYYAWIQHDAAIAPGNSGGPLVDLSGRIVGVNTRGMIFGGDLAFAIPGPDARDVVNALIEHGEIKRSHLGFRLRSLKGTGETEGVLVNSVERGSAAEKAGLRAGDRIVSIDGEAVTTLHPVDVPALQRRIAELPVGAEVRLGIAQDGKRREVSLTTRAQPEDRGEERAFEPFGASLAELTAAMGRRRNLEGERGLLVTGLRPGGPAAIARPALEEGDLVLSVDGKPVPDLAALEAVAGEPPAQDRPLVIETRRGPERRVSLLVPRHGDQMRVPLPELDKAWAGVEVQPITSSLARGLGLPGPGFRITRIYPGSPLGEAGARIGDLLTGIDGVALRVANETSDMPFHQRVRDLAVDQQVSFEALRGDRELAFEVSLRDAPANTASLRTLALAKLRAQTRELGFFDRAARDLPSSQQGVMVDGVEAGGPAGLAHLRRGDIIVRLGDKAVADLPGLRAALDQALEEGNGRVIPVQVLRGAETRILYLERYWLTESP